MAKCENYFAVYTCMHISGVTFIPYGCVCSHVVCWLIMLMSPTLREESSQTNVILQYKLLASILIAVCSVIQQS